MAMLPYSKLKHSSRHILSFGIVLILTFVFNPRAHASTECKTLHTAGAQQWFPYAFNEFEGRLKATGIAFDVLTLLARDLGVTLKIETGLPWKRIESKLDAGELDILAGTIGTKLVVENGLSPHRLQQKRFTLCSLLHFLKREVPTFRLTHSRNILV